MRLENWMPSAGWRVGRMIHVTDCPTCGELSEFYACDVFGCLNTDLIASYWSDTADKHVNVCSKHAEIATQEEKYGEIKDTD